MPRAKKPSSDHTPARHTPVHAKPAHQGEHEPEPEGDRLTLADEPPPAAPAAVTLSTKSDIEAELQRLRAATRLIADALLPNQLLSGERAAHVQELLKAPEER